MPELAGRGGGPDADAALGPEPLDALAELDGASCGCEVLAWEGANAGVGKGFCDEVEVEVVAVAVESAPLVRDARGEGEGGAAATTDMAAEGACKPGDRS